jgi:2-hydroxychromene-2-carboxylate isomerase
MDKIPARWYFDVISPYAYLHFKRFNELPAALAIEFVPVLFAGLLKAWDTKGPAELPAKRTHTYRQCVWLAALHGIPFTMPPRHPFNPLAVLRLLIARGVQRADIHTVFDFIWGQGRDPEAEWSALHEALQIADAAPLIADPAVKAKLVQNTERAVAAGVWGVPTFEIRGQLFWGGDTLEWMNAFIANPALFDAPGMRRADSTGAGVVRRQ